MSSICQVHLGPDGPSFTTKAQATRDLQADMSKALVAGLVNDAGLQKAALDRFRAARFFSIRDDSMSMADIRGDGNVARRGRWLSPTRDMMIGPTWDQPMSQELFHHRDNSIPVFGHRVGAGVNAEKFVDEVDRLMKRGLLTAADFPDFDSDESMVQLFGKVHDIATEEAKSKVADRGERNRVIDAAPGLYLFSELLKHTNRLIEEDFSELWARRIFSILNLNTWMPQWMFQRIDDRTILPSYIDVERLPSNAPRGSENRAADVRPLAFYHHAASWSKIELMRYAEAVASNSAANIKIDQRRINNAIRMMNFKEDLITFFGDDDVNILGLFSPSAKTGIERVPSGGKFGAGTPEDDRNLLLREVKKIRENTEKVLQPDTIMLSINTFQYVTTALYGSVDSDAGTNQTILEMARKSLMELGIKDILEVPEVGYSASQEKRLKAQALSDPQAAKFAGGDGDGNQAMVVCNRSAEVMEMVVAKDRIMYPSQEERTDRIETRMLQGSGGLAVYKPEGAKIVTDVGPA